MASVPSPRGLMGHGGPARASACAGGREERGRIRRQSDTCFFLGFLSIESQMQLVIEKVIMK